MRIWRVLSVICLLVISSGCVFRDDLLQYRGVRVGLTKLYHLFESLFDENYAEEEQVDDIFEYLVASSEKTDENHETDENNTDTRTCYTWSSLNVLVDEVHQRLMNNSIALHEQTNRIEHDLGKSIKSVEALTDSFEVRLSWFSDHVDKIITPTTDHFFEIIRASLANIKELQASIKTMFTKLDADHLKLQRANIVRFAKVQRQFEKVIQSQNNAHLECTCDVVKVMDDVTSMYFGDTDNCIDRAVDRLQEVYDSLDISLNHAVKIVTHATVPGIKPKESVYDIHFKLPGPVRIIFMFSFFVEYVQCAH